MSNAPPLPMHEERCPTCKHLLFIGRIGPGTRVEIKCPKCRNPKPVIVIEAPRDAA